MVFGWSVFLCFMNSDLLLKALQHIQHFNSFKVCGVELVWSLWLNHLVPTSLFQLGLYKAWPNNFPNPLPRAWRKRICTWKARCGYSLLGTEHRKCLMYCSAQYHSLMLLHNRAVEEDCPGPTGHSSSFNVFCHFYI